LRKVSCAAEVEMGTDGESSTLSVTLFLFGTKALFGVVSLEEVVVTQLAFLPLTRVAVQPDGKFGVLTASKSSENVSASAPRENSKATASRTAVPSCRVSVASRVSPHVSPLAAVNEKDRLTDAPPAVSAP
jgi:hypothetical protein